MKLIICGSRTITGEIVVFEYIEKALSELRINKSHIDEVISGGAKGVDTIGENWAKKNSIPVKRFLPDWSLGKRAGPLRNIEMCEYAGKSGVLVCIHDGISKGSLQCYNYGENMGMKCVKYIIMNALDKLNEVLSSIPTGDIIDIIWGDVKDEEKFIRETWREIK